MADKYDMGPRCKYCGQWTTLVQFSPRLNVAKSMTVCEFCDRYSEQRAPERSQTAE